MIQRLIRNYRAINQLNQRDAAGAGDLASRGAPIADRRAGPESAQRADHSAAVPTKSTAKAPRTQQVTGARQRADSRRARRDSRCAGDCSWRQSPPGMQGKLDDADRLLSEAHGKLSWRFATAAPVRALAERGNRCRAGTGRRSAAATGAGAIGAFDKAIAVTGRQLPEIAGAACRQGPQGGLPGAQRRRGRRQRACSTRSSTRAPIVADSGDRAARICLRPISRLLARDGSADAAARDVPRLAGAAAAGRRPDPGGACPAICRKAMTRRARCSGWPSRAPARSSAPRPRSRRLDRQAERDRRAGLEQSAAAKSSLEAMRGRTDRLQAQLATYPRYKVLAPQEPSSSTSCRPRCAPGEGYYKMMVVGDAVYALVRHERRGAGVGWHRRRGNGDGRRRARATSSSGSRMARRSPIRSTLVRARALYLHAVRTDRRRGAGAEASDLRARRADASAAALFAGRTPARARRLSARGRRRPDADPFDFTGVDWLGRGREVSISVSPRSFLDMRAIAPVAGAPAPISALAANAVALTRPVAAVADECDWPLATWQAPIARGRARLSPRRAFGPASSKVDDRRGVHRHGAAAAIDGLDDYRVLHFATHGLVTAPRPTARRGRRW